MKQVPTVSVQKKKAKKKARTETMSPLAKEHLKNTVQRAEKAALIRVNRVCKMTKIMNTRIDLSPCAESSVCESNEVEP